MATTITLNGTSYNIADIAETGYGQDHRAYFIALATGVLSKAGGAFTLTSEVDFGASYGLKSLYFKDRGTVSSAGSVRLSNDNSIGWRDNANSADKLLKTNTSDRLEFDSVAIPTISSTDTITNKTMTSAGNTLTIDADVSTVSNIKNAEIKAGAAIDAAKIHDGSVSNTEFGYLGGVTSDIQTQLDAAVDLTADVTGTLPIANGGTNGTTQTAAMDNLSPTTTKGDLLVDDGTNVVREAIGADGLILKADSSTSSGVAWGSASSGSGEVNYIDNPDAESNTTGWATYADAAGTTPVDGTAGSANITFTRQSGTILRGNQSFKITKDAADRQGEGASYDFTIKEQDTSKKLKIQFDFKTDEDAAYAAGDLAVYIYDVTNSTLITPVDTDIISGQNIFQTSFNSTTSTSYRLIFHVASTNASAWDAYIDAVIVGPGMTSQGAAIGPWTEWTITASWTTNVTHTGFYRRVGDTLEVMGTTSLSGTPDNNTLLITLPDSLNINSSLIPGTGSSNSLGTGLARDATGATAQVTANYDGSTTTSFRFVWGQDASAANVVAQSLPWSWASGDDIRWNAKIPIQEWAGKGIVPMLAEDNLSEWTAYTPAGLTGGEWGNSTSIDTEYRRIGDSIQIRGRFTTGSVTADPAQFDLPAGLTIGGNVSTRVIAGSLVRNANSGNELLLLATKGETYCTLGIRSATNNGITEVNVSGTVNSSEVQSIQVYSLPIAEWAGSQNSLVGYSEASSDNLGLVKKLGQNEVFVSGDNGYGSNTNNKIRRYATTNTDTGSAITYADSSTDGATFTVNESGIYSIITMDYRSGANSNPGFSINSSQLTTAIASITITDIGAYTFGISNVTAAVSGTLWLNSGDVVRPHQNGASTSGGDTSFRITKVSVS